MYGGYDSSKAAKTVVTVLHAGGVATAVWFLTDGNRIVSGWLGVDFPQADPIRRVMLTILSIGYFGRFLITTHLTLKRSMAVPEALTVGMWVFVIHATMAFTGGTNPDAAGTAIEVGVGLYLLGSCLNTGSELQRLLWKRRPGNRGRLYTGGLFRFSRHPNYLGDVTLFTGFALVTGTVSAFVIPLIMAVMFVFINIPMLDRYLAGHYGDDFDRYAAKTSKLVPFVY